jgi:hypothetical protein
MRAACFLAIALLAPAAQAAIPLCVEVRADGDDASFRKLVDDELAHHPSHHVVTTGCLSGLAVELFTVAGARYLTARVNQEVPVRFAVRSARELEDKLSEALRQVLHHDPIYLAEDLPRLNAVWRAGANLIRRGTNRYRVELFEVVGSGGRNPVFASGGAFGVTRGVDHLQLFARVAGAGSPRGLGDDRVVLRALVGADLGCLWEASARANTTFYLGGGVGIHYLRFEGKQDGRELAPVDMALFSVAVRTGIRFLRFYAADLDLFAQLHLPLYKTADPDSTLLDAYTPYVMVGLGVGF